MGLVHATHKTPHMAVMLSAAIVLVLFLALLPQGLLNGFGLTGTIATYGFVVVYLGVCLSMPVDLYRAGVMKIQHVIYGFIWFAVLKSKSPGTLRLIAEDMEG